MNCNKLREAARPRLPALVLAICLAQPGLDVLSYWLDELGLGNTVTLALRFGLLFALAGLGFFLSPKKRVYWIAAGVLGAFTLCHVAMCVRQGYRNPVSDLVNLVRIYQLPVFTLAFATLFGQNRETLKSVRVGFFWNLVVILLVEVLSEVTGTNPYTYPNKEVGILGWFYFANAQSAILSMIVPVALAWVMEKKKYHPGWTALACLGAFGVLYFFATRLSYAALLGTAGAFAVSLMLIKWLHKAPSGKAAAVMAVCAVLAVALVGLSPMTENNRLAQINAQLKQQDIDTLVAADDAAAVEAGLTGEERTLASLKSAYEKYLHGPTGRFGLERTAREYGFSTSVSDLSDDRRQKITYCLMLLEDQPESKLFGLELEDMTYNGYIYDVENDFHGIYILCGWTGLGLMASFICFFLGRIAAVLVLDFKRHFTLENVGYGIALICGLAHAYFTAGVLRRPNTTFYLAVVLAAVFVLPRNALLRKEVSHDQ